jgi:uncharacterized protein DUF4405
MKRANLNFVVDVLAFVAFLVLLSTGIVMRYQLPPGSGGVAGRGTGHGAGQQTVLLLGGWTRHEWGDIHYWVAALLLTVLALHLFLHWKWIVGVVRGNRVESSGWRFGVGLASLCCLLLLAAAPLFAPVESASREQLGGNGVVNVSDVDEIRGSSTLSEVAVESGLSIENLREQLGLSEQVSPDTSIGPALRQHGKRMSDLRRLINTPKADQSPEDGGVNQ